MSNMAPRKSCIKNNIVARLVTGKKLPCAFCNRQVDDELLYGKIYAIGDIQCHYYCVLLSSCLIQKGKDEHGLFGFLYTDILAEVERCKKHKCSYCNNIGANLGCSISQCRKQFHLPCGKERNSVSLFYGNYKTFCQQHVPKQKIPDSIMAKAKLRKTLENKSKKTQNCFKDLKELSLNDNNDINSDAQSVCVICYEPVEGYPTVNTFWPPCCARDAWFHRTCLQRMALSAGMHYLKCPLCNDKEQFYEAVISQGYYVPDRDAAWELEQNAFAEIYERPIACSASECNCPMGRSHDADTGSWSISICMLCGSSGQHSGCMSEQGSGLYICEVCKPAAPQDLDHLASSIEAVISQEQAQTSSRRRHGPIMPSRMSLRRTKRNINGQLIPTTSNAVAVRSEISETPNTAASRQSLNLKPPRKQSSTDSPIIFQTLTKNKYDSPTKILEEGLKNKFGTTEGLLKEELVRELRNRFKRPQPLSVKRKIVNDILNGFFDNLLQERKQKEPTIPWSSPKKCSDSSEDVKLIQDKPEIIDLTSKETTSEDMAIPKFTQNKLRTFNIEKNSSLEISAKDEIVNIDVFKVENEFISADNITAGNSLAEHPNCTFKFSPCNKEIIQKNIDHIDLESFKNQYLNEVSLRKAINRKRKYDDENDMLLKYKSKNRNMKKRSIKIKNKNIQLKIKWREQQLNLQLNDVKKIRKLKKYKQYILKYCIEESDRDSVVDEKVSVITKPDVDVTPIKKRKYVKQEKSPDNLVQTSLDKFFKNNNPKE